MELASDLAPENGLSGRDGDYRIVPLAWSHVDPLSAPELLLGAMMHASCRALTDRLLTAAPRRMDRVRVGDYARMWPTSNQQSTR